MIYGRPQSLSVEKQKILVDDHSSLQDSSQKEVDGTYTAIVPSLPGCLTFEHAVE